MADRGLSFGQVPGRHRTSGGRSVRRSSGEGPHHMITALALSPPAQELNDVTVSPGLIGSLVVLSLIIAMVFLLRSMSKQIGKIQAPKQADLDQAEWEAKQAKSDASSSD